VRLRAIWMEAIYPSTFSAALTLLVGSSNFKTIVSEMTYKLLNGMFNITQPWQEPGPASNLSATSESWLNQ